MQWALHTTETRCDEVGLPVNPDKSGLVFTSRTLPCFFEPHFFGVTLRFSRSVKYLVVVLDSRLTWRKHVDVKVRKAHNLLWVCRRTCGATWGLRPKAVHWFYVFIIRSSITFASLVWWPGCQTVNAKKTLKVRPHRTRSAAADCGLCPLRNVTF